MSWHHRLDFTSRAAGSAPAPTAHRSVGRAIVLAIVMVASVLVVAAPGAQAQSDTIWVAPWGDDSNPGTESRPKYSIVSGMQALPNGGDILMRGGEYYYTAGQSGLYRGGTADRPLQIRSAPGERASVTSAPGAYCAIALGDYTQIRNIDCTGYMGIMGYNASHIRISGNYVHDLTANRTQGIIVSSANTVDIRNIKIKNNVVRRVPQTGIAVGAGRQGAATRVRVNKNTVEQANYQFRNNAAQLGGWGSGISVIGTSDAKIKKNDVRRTYGEGINCPLSDRCRVKRNTVVDAWNVAYYGDNTSNSIWEDNVARWSGDTTFTRDYGFGAWQASAFALGNEDGWIQGAGNAPRNNIIRNNVAIGMFHGVGLIVQSSASFTNTLIANNTFVDMHCGFSFRSTANMSGFEVYNNIVDTTSAGSGNCGGTSGSTFRNNLWVDGNGGNAAHSSDRNGGAGFVGGDPTRAGSYKLGSSSRAIDTGRTVPQVTDDRARLARPRGAAYDIGAYEY